MYIFASAAFVLIRRSAFKPESRRVRVRERTSDDCACARLKGHQYKKSRHAQIAVRAWGREVWNPFHRASSNAAQLSPEFKSLELFVTHFDIPKYHKSGAMHHMRVHSSNLAGCFDPRASTSKLSNVSIVTEHHNPRRASPTSPT